MFCKHAQPRHVSLVGRNAAEAPKQKRTARGVLNRTECTLLVPLWSLGHRRN